METTIIRTSRMSLPEIQEKFKKGGIVIDIYDAVRIQVFLREYPFNADEIIKAMRDNQIDTVKEFLNKMQN